MNLGCEDDELKPYVEPEQDFKEPKRIGVFVIVIIVRSDLAYFYYKFNIFV